jgi:hypothetical protein
MLCVVCSSPWAAGAEGGLRGEKFKNIEQFAAKMSAADGHGNRHAASVEARIAQFQRDAGKIYGETLGQLGAMKEGKHTMGSSGVATWTESTWAGCYDGNWKGVVVPDAFKHPAKYSRALIRRIYQHMLAQGYVKRGQLVIDPFGGVALGAMDAMELGLRWVGCELEPHFHKLGNENLALWEKRWGLTGGRLLQGDSRRLASVLAEAQVCVSSPPYSGMEGHASMGHPEKHCKGGSLMKHCTTGARAGDEKMGHTEGNLASMPEGQHAAVLSSPPYAAMIRGAHGETETAAESTAKRKTPGGSLGQSQRNGGYGVSDGNLSGMPEGVVSSPPYAESRVSPDGNFTSEKYPAGQEARGAEEGYGIVSSPPYECSDHAMVQAKTGSVGRDYREHGKGPRAMDTLHNEQYGITPGQLGQEQADTFWAAARTIVEQCRLILPVGAFAAWVVKAFVRDGKIVDFPDQWRQMCEACGFETVEWINASLVKETHEHTLFEGRKTKKTARKSFFRRLHERKRPDLAIDAEVVLMMRAI